SGVAIPVRGTEWLARRDLGEQITCTDSRGRERVLTVVDVIAGAVLCELSRTCYFVPGMRLTGDEGEHTEVGALPAMEQKLQLFSGDVLTLTRDLSPIDPA